MWSARAALPRPVQEIYPAAFAGGIVLAGGIAGSPQAPRTATDATVIYDPAFNVWRDGPRLPQALHHPYLLAIGKELLAVGGYAGGSLEDVASWRMRPSVLALDDRFMAWLPGPSLPSPRAEFAAGVIGGNAVVAGGRQPVSLANERYEDHADDAATLVLPPGAPSWCPARPMPTARNSAAAVVVEGKMHVIGGRRVANGSQENLDVHEVYDVAGDRWEALSKPPFKLAGLAGARLNGCIYVFGGEAFTPEPETAFADVWQYDLNADRWSRLDPMPEPRHGHGAVALDNNIHLIGGAVGPSMSGTSNYHHVFSVRSET